jgi:hypothetical protein
MIAIAGLCFGLAASGSLPARSEGPAVSDINAKISGFGGGIGSGDEAGIGGLAGSLSLPLAYSYGLQIDGAYARFGDGNFGSAGAHLFWRDPTAGLLGLYAGYSHLDRFGGIDIARTGVEAQYYLPQLTFDFAAGAKFGSIDSEAYGRTRLQYYAIDDLMIQGGWVYEGRSYASAGIEYQFSTSPTLGMSSFADINIGSDDNYAVLAGLKFTFGQSMSLKDRHRRQDPDSYSSFDLLSATQAAAEEKAKREANKSTPAACPFTPSNNLCSFAALQPRYYPKIGYIKVAPDVSTVGGLLIPRYLQCQQAGYSGGNPGPASCGCEQAFNACDD